ncbi:sterol desaturase family protein [Fulvivirgaceae bacterium BMA12]|uniref:Sterol desaturase family protein n=1 Tax=Agaribacillus aureus TaxID=3051825 RepID=A0ABT8LJ67_9BACT|nr:sterol desaturase family protein [Fulvivirgaceae bacterium BMA12]
MSLIETFKNIIIVDFLRYFIPASIGFLLFWILFKKRLQHRFIQKTRPKIARLWAEFKYSMSTVFIFAGVGLGVVTAKKYGVFHIYESIATFGWVYFFASLFFMILFHDFYFYWTHRWMHHPKIFKHVHLVHHLSTNPSPWAAYSFHPIEAFIQALVLPILLFMLPLHNLVIFIFLIYMITRNVWGHLGYELLPKKFINFKWLNWHTTTTHHSMHHQYSSCNFGLYFTWWDNWMKTTHKKYRESFEEITSRPNKDTN